MEPTNKEENANPTAGQTPNPTETPAAAAAPVTPDLKLHVNPNPNAGTNEGSLDFVMDIPLKVTVELGRTRMLVQDLLKIHKGSVIELTKMAGDSLEVLVNDRVLARGEVVVVNDKFGIRLTDVVSHAQRIRSLGA